MAGLIKRGNKYTAVIYDKNGKQRRVATGIDVTPKAGQGTPAQNKKAAQKIADTLEAKAKGLISGAVAKAYLLAAAKVDDTPVITAREYLTAYRPSGKEQNQANARRAVRLLLDFLSTRKMDKQALADIKPKHCTEFLGELLMQVSVGTVRAHKIHISTAFNRAVSNELLTKNPMAFVRLSDIVNQYAPETKGKDKTEREPFTAEEMHRIFTQFPQPYNDLAAVSFYTGQRIGDCISLTWQQVDFERGLIVFLTQKTARHIPQPLLPELRRRLEARRELTTDKDEPQVFPELARMAIRRKGAVSTEFTHLLLAHGIVQKRPAEIKMGRRRNQSSKTFHSIRHSAASIMQERGVPQAVSMDVVGHGSRAVHEAYTSTSYAARAEAIAKLEEAVLSADATSAPNHTTP